MDLGDVLDAEGRAVGAHHRVGAVNLGDPEAELVQEAAEGAGVGLEGDARVVAEGGDEVLAVDGAELDVLEAGGGDFLAGGFEANAQGPPVVGVNSYVNHGDVVVRGGAGGQVGRRSNSRAEVSSRNLHLPAAGCGIAIKHWDSDQDFERA